jgi:DNA (cytosine-5)-methyltransferase 1
MSAQIADTSSRNEYLDILDEAWQQHLEPRADNAPTVISTFAGCGGSSLGYSMAGFQELLAVEWDDNAVETFRLNFPDVPVYHGDIAKLSVDEVLQMTGLQPGELDVLDGSPPCQGFSTAGKRQLDDDRNQLFREYVRLLRGLRPKVFVMENVSGMVKGKMKLIFAEVMRGLKASGYRVKCQLMNAMYFNVPQSRQRLIFIGVRDDIDIEPSHPKAERKPFGIEDGCPNVKGLKINYTMMNGMVLDGSRPWHKSTEPAPTLSKSGNYAIFDNGKLRRFTKLEAMRVGSFPDNFKFNKVFTMQIGNSVPPLFMRSIARHIRENILQPTRAG